MCAKVVVIVHTARPCLCLLNHRKIFVGFYAIFWCTELLNIKLSAVWLKKIINSFLYFMVVKQRPNCPLACLLLCISMLPAIFFSFVNPKHNIMWKKKINPIPAKTMTDSFVPIFPAFNKCSRVQISQVTITWCSLSILRKCF